MKNKYFMFFRVFVALLLIGAVLIPPQATQALDDKQKRLFNKGIYHYNYDSCQVTSSAEDSSVEVASDGSVYQSGVSGPYILEQWAIHTLKAIAQKQNIDESKTVTQEHVIALLAFAIGEGGDIANQDIFNPLNTGINAPELIEGAHAVDGVQSFKSFDAGVEAAARTMVGSNQNRTAKTLSNPSSNANDFMKALTYYQRYKNNKFWAAASLPPAQDSYYEQRQSLVKQVKSNYKDIASLIIGTAELEQKTGKRDASKLTYDGKGSGSVGDTGNTAGAAGCVCSVAGNDTSDDLLVGSTNAEKAFRYLVENGMTPEQAAGAVGNFMQESGGGTEDIDTNATNPSGYKGIAQWDPSSRWPALVKYAAEKGTGKDKDPSPRSLLTQLDFALQEAQMKTFLDAKSSSVAAAAEDFDKWFEGSGGSALDKRKQYAQEIYSKYKDKVTTPSGETASSKGEDCSDTGSDGGAFVDEGYAWPVDLNKADSSAGYGLPCMSASCHHDGTPAFDLAHTDTVKGGNDKASVGVAVYAIADGEIAKAGIYMGIPGCYSIEFKAKDGYVYWYGHIRKPVSQQVGKKFSVGEKIAEIGERKCTGNGSYPHLHIDRGSPKGAFGGSVCCRDSGMKDIINGLYGKLK